MKSCRCKHIQAFINQSKSLHVFTATVPQFHRPSSATLVVQSGCWVDVRPEPCRTAVLLNKTQLLHSIGNSSENQGIGRNANIFRAVD